MPYLVRMRTILRPAAAALVLFAALAATGCTPGPAKPHTPTPSSTPLFASDEEALAAAEEAYAAYLAVSDQIFQDGGREPDRLLEVATEQVVNAQMDGYEQAAANGWTSTGSTKLDTVSLQWFDPDRTKAAISIYGCVDLSGVDVVDANGTSVVSANRPDRSPFQVTFDLSSTNASQIVVSGEKPWTGENFCL